MANQPQRMRLAVAGSASIPVACVGALFALAALTDSVWPQLLGCAVLGVLVTSFLAVARPTRIEVGVEMPDRVVVGKPFETAIVLHNVSGRTARALVVRHSWPTGRTLVAAHATFVDRIDAHRDLVIATTRTAAARGVLFASEVRIDAIAPFGFFSRSLVVPIEHELLVLPTVAAMDSVVAGACDDALTPRANGTDVGGVREWRSGDQVRSVRWRSTARTGRLTVIDRFDVAVGSLVVLIAGRNGDPALEEAISKAAAVGSVALRRGTAVFVARDDGSWVQARTEGTLAELLARADVSEPLNDAALRRVMRCAVDGGSVLVAAGRGVSGAWLPAVQRAAVFAGVAVVDLADPPVGVAVARARG